MEYADGPAEILAWAANFEMLHGRPPRVDEVLFSSGIQGAAHKVLQALTFERAALLKGRVVAAEHLAGGP